MFKEQNVADNANRVTFNGTLIKGKKNSQYHNKHRGESKYVLVKLCQIRKLIES